MEVILNVQEQLLIQVADDYALLASHYGRS